MTALIDFTRSMSPDQWLGGFVVVVFVLVVWGIAGEGSK